jgi:hypothetical protein
MGTNSKNSKDDSFDFGDLELKGTNNYSACMVTISQQVWAKENLNTERFRNDDLIPEAKTNEEWKKAGITFTKKYNGKTLEIQVEYEDFTTQKPSFITVDFIKNKIRE